MIDLSQMRETFGYKLGDIIQVATATRNPTISVRIRQNHLINSPNGAMNGDA